MELRQALTMLVEDWRGKSQTSEIRMKLMMVMAVCLFFNACSPYRHGSVIVTPFDTAGHRVSDKLDITDEDVLLQVSNKLPAQIKANLLDQSEMTVSEKCDANVYILEGKIPIMYSVVIRGHKYFSVSAEGVLKDCKTGEEIVRFNASSGDCNSLHDSLYYLSSRIINQLKRY